MLIFREQQLPHIFGQLNANVSSLLFSQIKTQIMNQYYKYLTHVYFLKKLVTPEIFQLFFFSTPKQNPADKQYMPQKHLQLKTVAAYMCCSQPG